MNKLYNDTAVQAIANAIRAKNGSSDAYTIAEMSTALNDISYYAKPTISNVQLATFEADGLPLNSLKVSVEAKQSGSGTPSPENVRPISGWSEANVSDVGKNLLKVTATTTTSQGVTFTVNDDGSVTCSGTATGVAQLLLAYEMPITSKVGTVTLSGLANTTNIVWNYITGFDDNGVALFDDTRSSTLSKTYDLSQYPTLSKINISIKRYQNGAVSGTIYPQLEIGETTTAFEPYNSTTTTISLPQTVYGAEVDVVNGVLKITDGYIASYNGETLPSTWISSMDVYAEGTTPTTGAEVVYTLASSTTVSLTPTLIKSLNGQNNLSVDCGDVIELEYFKEV